MGNQTLHVGVTFKVATGTGGGKAATFSVDKLKVDAKERDMTIIWSLTREETRWGTLAGEPGIFFGDDWITDGFTQPQLHEDGTYKVAYTNNVKVFTYKYTIIVSHGHQVLRFDPEVQNQPPTIPFEPLKPAKP
jgi:hypothetical protein